MGFDAPNGNDFKIPVSDTRAYQQFGNSVIVPVMHEIARVMRPHIVAIKKEESLDSKQLRLVA